MPDDDARGDAADEDEQDGGAREEADYTDYTQQRLDPKTLADYRRQWRSVVEWVKVKHPLHYNAEKDNVNPAGVERTVYKEFFDVVSRKRKRGGQQSSIWNDQIDDEQTGYSNMNGWCNSIKHQYREQEVDMPPDHKKLFADHLAGYKRHTAKLKQQGKMKLQEGKLHIRFKAYRYTHDVFACMCMRAWLRSMSCACAGSSHGSASRRARMSGCRPVCGRSCSCAGT
jgi:hypothetical protein